MKTLFTAVTALLIASISVQAQSPLLTSYYAVKDALVKTDPATASSKSAEFIKAANDFDIKTLPAAKLNTVETILKKLSVNAQLITDNKNIVKQREYFSSLSNDFFLLAKEVKLSDEPIYQAYCPMKKAYWLSNETGIRNPYFGQSMLTCGSITATIKP